MVPGGFIARTCGGRIVTILIAAIVHTSRFFHRHAARTFVTAVAVGTALLLRGHALGWARRSSAVAGEGEGPCDGQTLVGPRNGVRGLCWMGSAHGPVLVAVRTAVIEPAPTDL